MHRDVKPGNVLIEASGQVKVTDFGVARADASEALTQTGSVMGTATYFSPEQAQGLVVDGRSDVYSLGVVLYEMVCGTPPFAGENPVSVAYQHVREPVPPLRERQPDVPPVLEQIIMTALEKDPNRRYQSADDLRADLLRFRRGREIVGGPLTAQIADVPSSGTAAVGARSVVAGAADHKKRNPSAIAASWCCSSRSSVVPRSSSPVRSARPRAAAAATPTFRTWSPIPPPTSRSRAATLKAAGFTVSVDHDRERLAEEGRGRQPIPCRRHPRPQGRRRPPRRESRSGRRAHPRCCRERAGRGGCRGPGRRVHDDDDRRSEQATSREGRVIRTVPVAGELRQKGSNVQLVISSGPPTAPVPDVTGQPQTAAANRLGQAGFQTRTTEEASDTVVSGNVIRTEPAAGSEAPEEQHRHDRRLDGPRPGRGARRRRQHAVDRRAGDLRRGPLGLGAEGALDPGGRRQGERPVARARARR